MLTLLKVNFKSHRLPSTLLFFISLILFHSTVLADFNKETAESYRVQGYEEQQKGNLNQALTLYTKAVALGLDNPQVWNDMGILYEQFGIFNKAESSYQKAIQSDKSYLPAYLNIAYLYLDAGDKDKAFTYFKKRYELAEANDPWAEKAKEEILKIRPSYASWIVSLEAERLNKQLEMQAQEEFQEQLEKSAAHYKRGQRFLDNDLYEEAVQEFNVALSFTPQNPKVINARKKALLEMTKHNIREYSDMAIKQLNAGDAMSARTEINKMLTTIPKEPVLIR